MTETTQMPIDLTSGKVVGRFVLAVSDGPDIDRLPDAKPASGKITISSIRPVVKAYSPEPTTVIRTVFTTTIDDDGYLVDEQGVRGVWLVCGEYRVSYNLLGVQLETHPIVVLPEHVDASPLNLTTYLPVSGPVLNLTQYTELVNRIEGLQVIADSWSTVESAAQRAEAASAVAFGTRDDTVSQIMLDPGSKTWSAMNADFYRRTELSGLIPWRLAYSSPSPGGARIAVVGSNEGKAVSSSENRWMSVLAKELSTVENPGRWYTVGSTIPGVVDSVDVITSGNVESPTNRVELGFGNRPVYLKGADGALTRGVATIYPTPVTSVRVWYQRSDFFSAEGYLYVDNVNVGTIPAVGAEAILYYDYTLPSPGIKEIRVESAAGSNAPSFRLLGIQVFNDDYDSGVQVADATQQDATIRDLAWDRSNNWRTISAFQPDLVIVWIGDIDWLTNATGFIEGAVVDLSAKIAETVPGLHSVLYVLPPRPVPSSGSLDTARYAYLRSLLSAQAGADPNHVSLLDLGEYFPRFEAGSNAFGLASESTYPQALSEAGHRWAGEVIGALLK